MTAPEDDSVFCLTRTEENKLNGVCVKVREVAFQIKLIMKKNTDTCLRLFEVARVSDRAGKCLAGFGYRLRKQSENSDVDDIYVKTTPEMHCVF